MHSRDGFGPGPAQGPFDLGWAELAQIGLGPEKFGPNPSLRNGFGPGPAQGPINLGWAGPAQIGLGPEKSGSNPSLMHRILFTKRRRQTDHQSIWSVPTESILTIDVVGFYACHHRTILTHRVDKDHT